MYDITDVGATDVSFCLVVVVVVVLRVLSSLLLVLWLLLALQMVVLWFFSSSPGGNNDNDSEGNFSIEFATNACIDVICLLFVSLSGWLLPAWDDVYCT